MKGKRKEGKKERKSEVQPKGLCSETVTAALFLKVEN